MARVSSKENKNIYQKTRERLQLSREAASSLLESIYHAASFRQRHRV